jgi:dienelactone hydrolase
MIDAPSRGRLAGTLIVAAIIFLLCAMSAEAGVDQTARGRAEKIEPSAGEFFSDGLPIEEYHCVAKAPGQYPVVMLIHGCAPRTFGERDFQQMCIDLAEHGYYAMFLEYYGTAGAPSCRDLAMVPTVSLAPETPLPDDAWMRVLISARSSLADNPRADTSRLGAIGFSFGGTLAVITAALKPNLIDAMVDYYGFTNERVEDAVTKASNFPPTLILQGDADHRVHVTDAIHLRDVIAKRQSAGEIHVYPGVEHAFNFRDAVGYDGEASKDAWSRTLSFLDRHLK